MKKVLLYIVLALVGYIVFILLFYQTKESTSDSIAKLDGSVDWPIESDAVVAAPDSHQIVLENENVRVIEISLKPGEIEPMHSHRWPRVLYIQEAGDFIDRGVDGDVIFDTRHLEVALQLPMTMWREPEKSHSVKNLSDSKTIKIVQIEIKR